MNNIAIDLATTVAAVSIAESVEALVIRNCSCAVTATAVVAMQSDSVAWIKCVLFNPFVPLDVNVGINLN